MKTFNAHFDYRASISIFLVFFIICQWNVWQEFINLIKWEKNLYNVASLEFLLRSYLMNLKIKCFELIDGNRRQFSSSKDSHNFIFERKNLLNLKSFERTDVVCLGKKTMDYRRQSPMRVAFFVSANNFECENLDYVPTKVPWAGVNITNCL